MEAGRVGLPPVFLLHGIGANSLIGAAEGGRVLMVARLNANPQAECQLDLFADRAFAHVNPQFPVYKKSATRFRFKAHFEYDFRISGRSGYSVCRQSTDLVAKSSAAQGRLAVMPQSNPLSPYWPRQRSPPLAVSG